MPRMIRHDAFGPREVKPDPAGKSAWVCMCGLSRNLPFCDGSHKIARQNEQPEGKLYVYDKDRERVIEISEDT